MGQPHRIVRMATAQDLPYLHRLARHVVHQLLGGHHLTAAQVRAATAARIFEALRLTLGYRLGGRERTVPAGGVTVNVARMRKELTDERES